MKPKTHPRMPTENLYGQKRILENDGCCFLVQKVEEELKKMRFADVECCACSQTTRMTLEEAEANRTAQPWEKFYCGCGDE